MASIDLTDAHYNVSIGNYFKRFFAFQFQGKYFKYVCLPNGVTSFPRIFTKIMKSFLASLGKLGNNIMNYLDDIYICGDTFEESRDTVLATVNLLFRLGFSAHPEKSQFVSVQETEYFPFVINSITIKICLTKTKQDGIKKLLEEV